MTVLIKILRFTSAIGCIIVWNISDIESVLYLSIIDGVQLRGFREYPLSIRVSSNELRCVKFSSASSMMSIAVSTLMLV